jgi:hypothetical protein
MDQQKPFRISAFIWRDIRKDRFGTFLRFAAFILAGSLFSTYYLVNGSSESLNTGISRMGAANARYARVISYLKGGGDPHRAAVYILL